MNVTPSNVDRSRPTRRDILSLALKGLLGTSGLLALGGLVRFLDYQTEPPRKTVFDLGLANDYPVGTRTAVAGAQAILLRGEEGFRALSLVCPHLGCTVEPQPQGNFACPCHGSRFDARGGLAKGPADKGLRVLKLEVNAEGHLILYTQ